MQRDSKRICKRYRLRLLRRMKNEETKFGGRRESQLYNLEFIVQRKASAATCKIRLKSPCPAKEQSKSKEKIKKRIRVKRLRGGTSVIVRERFFDLSSVAAGLQSAMQQYYLPTIYIIGKRQKKDSWAADGRFCGKNRAGVGRWMKKA